MNCRTAAAATLSLSLLVGCAGRNDDVVLAESPSVATTSSAPIAPSPSPALSASESPEVPPETPEPLAFGKEVAVRDGAGSVTALKWRQPVATGIESDSPGTEWGSVLVRVCIHKPNPDGGGSRVTNSPWRAVYDDGSQYEPSNLTYNEFPQPEYLSDDDRVIPVGRCIKGWITFPVTKGVVPDLVSYSLDDLPTPLEWKIS